MRGVSSVLKHPWQLEANLVRLHHPREASGVSAGRLPLAPLGWWLRLRVTLRAVVWSEALWHPEAIMSSFQTHMLIGAVGGLALIQAADGVAPGFVAGLLPGQPRLSAEILVVAVSAISATVPDIDEPGSWLSRRVQGVITLAGLLGGGAVGLRLSERYAAELGMSWSAVFALCAIAGAALGSLLGWLLLRLIRAGAGGHRAGTHSVFFGGAMLLAAAVLHLVGVASLVALPLILAWGWALHIVGDVVTPAGWRPLSPASDWTLRLPRSVARYGEALVATAAVIVGWLLLRVG